METEIHSLTRNKEVLLKEAPVARSLFSDACWLTEAAHSSVITLIDNQGKVVSKPKSFLRMNSRGEWLLGASRSGPKSCLYSINNSSPLKTRARRRAAFQEEGR